MLLNHGHVGNARLSVFFRFWKVKTVNRDFFLMVNRKHRKSITQASVQTD